MTQRKAGLSKALLALEQTLSDLGPKYPSMAGELEQWKERVLAGLLSGGLNRMEVKALLAKGLTLLTGKGA